MEYITMIMSGLALLAATVSLILTVCEKKRNQKRNADLINYVDHVHNDVKEKVGLHEEFQSAIVDGLSRGIRQKSTEIDELKKKFKNQSTELDNLSTKVDNLEKGIVPDYEEALAAKNSVDEFNRGLSAIMGFDPMEAVKKSREQRKYGGEVK